MLNFYNTILYNGTRITDISQKVILENVDSYKTKKIYFDYFISGWKAPEELAYDFYGSCDEVWVILALNDIINPYTDWLLKDSELKKYISSKYKDVDAIHHYEKDGLNYNYAIINSIPISNYEYESNLNTMKRTVKILYPALLPELKSKIRARFKK